MPTIEVSVRRVSVVSSRPFDEILRRLTATIGHPDMHAFHSALAAATTAADLEDVVQGAIGSSDLMEFVRFDAGELLRKARGGRGPQIRRLVVGNPLIMKEMAKTVPTQRHTHRSRSSSTSALMVCTCRTTPWRVSSLRTGVSQLSPLPGSST